MEMEEMEWFEMMGDEMELVEKELGKMDEKRMRELEVKGEFGEWSKEEEEEYSGMIGGEVYFVDEVKGVFGKVKKEVERLGKLMAEAGEVSMECDVRYWSWVDEVWMKFGFMSEEEYGRLELEGDMWLMGLK
jgi:hypothetical protein